VATRHHPPSADDLLPVDLARWQTLRRHLARRHQTRRAQRRFRRNPAAYLADLEDRLLKPVLPA
jgi:hypothetical protein